VRDYQTNHSTSSSLN